MGPKSCFQTRLTRPPPEAVPEQPLAGQRAPPEPAPAPDGSSPRRSAASSLRPTWSTISGSWNCTTTSTGPAFRPPTDAAPAPCRHTRQKGPVLPSHRDAMACRHRRRRPAAPSHDGPSADSTRSAAPISALLNGSTRLPSFDVPSGNSTSVSPPPGGPGSDRAPRRSGCAACARRRPCAAAARGCRRTASSLTSDLATKEIGITAEKTTMSSQEV